MDFLDGIPIVISLSSTLLVSFGVNDLAESVGYNYPTNKAPGVHEIAIRTKFY